MNSVASYFEQAQLALAAYSNLSSGMALPAYEAALRDEAPKGVSFEYLFEDQPCLVAHALS